MQLFPRGVPASKRMLDLLLTVVGLLVISPFLILLSAIIWLVQGTPVIFKQQRPGFRNQLFQVYKFRTMREVYDEHGQLLPDAIRITRLGKILRSISIDELPELVNVLRGEMSLVGPRPLLSQYLERYTPEQARRHNVLPGVTGWAQVNGRNAISWEDKFRLDVWYVDHWTFGLDLKILLMTPWTVLQRRGITQPGHATAEEFMGSQISDRSSDLH